ncbi:MAG: NADH-quinone oxidoreductase subunit M [Bacteroidetes bacterium]|nr:NADH-quinone oxidoreductase subunit M [Bacteroidota bacterium]
MSFLIPLLIAIPVFSAVANYLVNANSARWIAAISGFIQLVISILIWKVYADFRAAGETAQFLLTAHYSWFPLWNINLDLGLDGISVTMLIMTSLVVFSASLLSWNVKNDAKLFFSLLNFLSAGAYGFFSSLDLFAMFFFLELAVVPKFLLIGIWGSGEKIASAMKLVLMLMGGSALLLTGLFVVYYGAGGNFSLTELASNRLGREIQLVAFPLLFIGFGVFTALFPFHTWVPDGHSSAPTAGSMFLAGISMKLGAYGCLRVATYLLPDAAVAYSPYVIILSSIAIVYGALATLMQTDLKYMNAYSSISHCGFILLGIGMQTNASILGSVMQMVSHGLMTALFFGAIGLIYQRTHTRKMEEMGGLLKSIPFLSAVFVIAGLCSLGLPGFSGFVSEMTIFVGSWEHSDAFHRVATILAAASIVVTAIYILSAIGKVIFGPIRQASHISLEPATFVEKLGTGVLVLAILFMGLVPFWFTNLISEDARLIMNQFTLLMNP